MRLPATLTSLVYLLISTPRIAAGPLVPKDELESNWDWARHIFDRQIQCAGTYCGMSSQYCCTGGSVCFTDAQTIARCAAATAAPTGNWQYYTTTIVQTDLVTVVSTYSSFIGVVATTTQPLAQSTQVCDANQGSCGAVCCVNSVEYCFALGKCTPWGAAPTSSSYSAPLRPTSGILTTVVTANVPVTTTQPFQTPVATGNSTGFIVATSANNGLSGGAIAGIVIGVLAGIIILIAICFFCILRTGFDALLGIFGLGNKRREERTEVITERYSRHGSDSASRRGQQSRWYGGGGGRTRVEEKRSSGLVKEGGILAGLALGLAGLWAILGLRRKQKAKTARSDVSYESYSDSYSETVSSDSSASSDRRTRETRGTRVTRESRRVTSRPQ